MHRRWTSAEVERLREMRAGGSTYQAIADEMRRSSSSVASKAARLGLAARRRRVRASGLTPHHVGRAWALATRLGLPERLARVAVLAASGYDRGQIGSAMGLKSSTVNKYFGALNDHLGLPITGPGIRDRLDLIRERVAAILQESNDDHDENL